jgi:hypothetical protein
VAGIARQLGARDFELNRDLGGLVVRRSVQVLDRAAEYLDDCTRRDEAE